MQPQELNLTDARVFEHEVEQRLAGTATAVSVLIVDMGDVNRLLARAGPVVSATFLQSFAKLLLGVCRDGDIVCRIGDCTFGIVLQNVAESVMQQLAAEKIIRMYEAAVRDMGISSCKLRVGIGIAGYPDSADDAADLIRNARMALESATTKGDPYHVYSPSSHETISMRWSLQDDLVKAIEQGDFEVVYQPKISVTTGRPVGAEALLRWSHPAHGAVPPSVFLTLACELGMIDQLTSLVLTTAIGHAGQWPDIGSKPSLAVNFEGRMLESPEFVNVIRKSLSLWGDAKVDLIVEITESALVVDSKSNFQQLHELRAMGIGVSIDDFGAGYSSLSFFRDIPATELKIDPSFVRNAQNCERNRNLIETIISMAHRFGMAVVAEGVETEAELDLLRRLNCDLVQGFHISEPLTNPELCEWLGQDFSAGQPAS